MWPPGQTGAAVQPLWGHAVVVFGIHKSGAAAYCLETPASRSMDENRQSPPPGGAVGLPGWGHGWAVEIWMASSPVRPMLLVHPDRQASHALSQPPPQPLSAPQGLRIRIRLRIEIRFRIRIGLDLGRTWLQVPFRY